MAAGTRPSLKGGSRPNVIFRLIKTKSSFKFLSFSEFYVGAKSYRRAAFSWRKGMSTGGSSMRGSHWNRFCRLPFHARLFVVRSSKKIFFLVMFFLESPRAFMQFSRRPRP
jgi:hypothetical protein